MAWSSIWRAKIFSATFAEYFLGRFAGREQQGGQSIHAEHRWLLKCSSPTMAACMTRRWGLVGSSFQRSLCRAHADEKHYNAAEPLQYLTFMGRSQPYYSVWLRWTLVIRGIDFGKQNADTFLNDQHRIYVPILLWLTHPSIWRVVRCEAEDDVRWWVHHRRVTPTAWMQHMIHHLAPKGSMALIQLTNGSDRTLTVLIRKIYAVRLSKLIWLNVW